MSTVDAVIVGAGVIGASCAFHLASLGMKKIVLLERGAAPGEGSTGRATGGFRAQYGSAINIRLSLLAREKLARFRDDTGVDPGFVQAGYLWLARSVDQLAELRAGNLLQRKEGLHEARMIDTAEASRLNPFVSSEGVLGAAFSPTDGFIVPLEILRGYLEGAKRLGAQVITQRAPVGFSIRNRRIESVLTKDRSIATGLVINAAGAWAAQVASLAGIDCPVLPLRRQVACTQLTDALPAAMPMTLWCDDGFHLRVRDGRVLLLRPSPGHPGDPFDTSVESDWLNEIEVTTRERVPALASVALDREQSWGGLYEVSPDQHALLGSLPVLENFYFANGSSGHGVMHAPAIGQLLAEMIVHGKASSLEVTALRPSRFDEGQPVSGAGVL